MAFTYMLPINEPERVAEACSAVAYSYTAWAENYGIQFESIVNQHDGTLAVTFTAELPDAEARSIRLVV